jgi:hypothetical protein
MKSGTFTSDTQFTATNATVNIPSGNTTVTVSGYNSASFTVPNGVKVVLVDAYGGDGIYVGVTPNKTYSLGGWEPLEHHTGDTGEAFLQSGSGVYWWGYPPDDFPDQARFGFVISWSPEINTHTPDVTDY